MRLLILPFLTFVGCCIGVTLSMDGCELFIKNGDGVAATVGVFVAALGVPAITAEIIRMN